ncbi:uncharacterized protein [Littorina saxatilis]|uniref:HSF-type DNA-binding domain-containing protein n=1 Tax=Littorina saxatilis TaxID=31220 RepID=A0AAN9C2A1_9CAEN
MESPPKMTHDSFAFRFPARLWRIINSCTTGAISWGPNGKTIRILRKKFEEEYLTGNAKPFKTAKYESFVRQLNHYGFKKVKKRSAIKKITTPIMHGETKEESAMLSEYHNPNFTRGNPERVTFLERRSQLQDEPGTKKRGKRASRAAVDNDDCQTSGKKGKKESSGSGSRNLLCSETDGLNTSADDNSETQSEYSKSETEGNGQDQMVNSRGDYAAMARHAGQPNGPPFTLKPLPPIYAPGSAGLVRMDGKTSNSARRLLHHRAYYSPDGYEGVYGEPYPLQRYPYPLSPTWQQRANGVSSRAQLYDDYVTAHAPSVRDRFFPRAYSADPRALYMARPSGGSRGYPMYGPEDGFSSRNAHGHNAWSSAYGGVNRRGMVPVADVYDESYDAEQFIPVGERLRYPDGSRGYRRPSPESRYYPADDSYLRHQYDSVLSSRAGMQVRPPFLPSGSHPLYPCDSELQDDTDDYTAAQRYHGDYAQSHARENGAYTDSSTYPEVTGLWKVDMKRAKGSSAQVAVQEVSGENGEKYIVRIQAEGSELDGRGDSHQQAGHRWLNGAVKGQGEASQNNNNNGSYSDSLSIITEDSADLPLDVAEETVVTCNTSGMAGDYSSHLIPYSSVDETVMMNTLMHNTAPLPAAEDGVRFYSQHSAPGVETYPNCHPSVIACPSSSSQCKLQADNYAAKEEPSEACTPSSVWRYLEKDMLKVAQPDVTSQQNTAAPWTFPASRLLEETAKKASANATRKTEEMEEGEEEEEKEMCIAVDAEARDNTVDSGGDSENSCAEVEIQGDPASKLSVQRTNKGDVSDDLIQPSCSCSQEMFSAKIADTEIVVDQNLPSSRTIESISKNQRYEIKAE